MVEKLEVVGCRLEEVDGTVNATPRRGGNGTDLIKRRKNVIAAVAGNVGEREREERSTEVAD